jgi:hypothetical protein
MAVGNIEGATRQGKDIVLCGEEARQLLPDEPACAGDGYFHIFQNLPDDRKDGGLAAVV